MVSSPSIIQELIPQLASSLGQLRRVPGKGDAWVAEIIATLQKDQDPRFERMRRRIGFAQRLGSMAEMSESNIALLTLGIFFHELLPVSAGGMKAPRPWREYLLRNEEWLRPAFDICEAVRYKGWQEVDDPAEIVAKIAVVYDSETLEHHQRPLAVVESILAEAEGRNAQPIVDLLWTEEGQALCDHHFRHHRRGYRLDPKDIRASMAKLYRVTPRISADLGLQSMRFGDTPKPVDKELGVVKHMAHPEKNGLNNFDRRRQALRTRTGDTEPMTAEPEMYAEHDRDEREHIEPPSRIETKLREIESSEQPREARMNQLATVSPTSRARGDALDVRDRLQQLRIQLGQIQQIAAQAEQLLNGIAPQIDEFATRIADVEAVMDRWSDRSRTAA